MREIKYIVLHCTATPQNTTVESILHYWRKNLGWKNPGYHYIITPDGGITNLADEQAVTNGVKGYNAHSIHVSYIGGVDANNNPIDNRTAEQRATVYAMLKYLLKKYPSAKLMGHRDFPNVSKACPSVDIRKWYGNTNLIEQ